MVEIKYVQEGLVAIESAAPSFGALFASFNSISHAFNAAAVKAVAEDEEKSVLDELDKFVENIKRLALFRHWPDNVKEFVTAVAGPVVDFSGIEVMSNILKTASGAADIYSGIRRQNTDEWLKGILEIITGGGKVASALGISVADIIYGITTIESARIDIREGISPEDEERKAEKTAADLSKMFSGVFRTASGVCSSFKPLFVLAPPFKILAGAFAFAAGAFADGNWILGWVSIAAGDALAIILAIAAKKILEIALIAILKLSATVASIMSATVVLMVVGLAIIATIAVIVATARASKPPVNCCAKGGFPATGQPFIAREAGPELVGRLNGRTAIVNNDQIVEAVSRGVYSAFNSAMFEGNSKGTTISRVFFDGKEIAMAKQV